MQLIKETFVLYLYQRHGTSFRSYMFFIICVCGLTIRSTCLLNMSPLSLSILSTRSHSRCTSCLVSTGASSQVHARLLLLLLILLIHCILLKLLLLLLAKSLHTAHEILCLKLTIIQIAKLRGAWTNLEQTASI